MNFIKPDWPAPSQIQAYTSLKAGWDDLSFPEEPIWLHQIHGNTVIEAHPDNRKKSADASFTNQANRVCVVTTADCIPILICNRKATCVAAVHAGWRGLASDIIKATLHAINQPPEDLLVWLGPGIGPQKFEVGSDVYDAFTTKHPASATAFIPHTPGKWLANLYELARIRLHQQGVTHIYGGTYCTYTQEDLFFSYRRDKGQTGRLATFIWRNS